MDEVYSAGIQGQLCNGDGRTSESPKKKLWQWRDSRWKKIYLSPHIQRPEEAFNSPDEYLFEGKSVDDLFFR